ncbi:DnaB-like helicase C-terminal domain-containing protein [Candidatus Vidania fulgoroideorum]
MTNEIEKYLLSCIIIDSNSIKNNKKIYKYFNNKKNIVIFKCILKILKKYKKIDLITIYYNINNKFKISIEYLNSIIKLDADPSKIEKYIKILKKIKIKKILKNILKKYIKILRYKKLKIKSLTKNIKLEINRIKFKKKKKIISFQELIKKKKYIKTGFRKLDNIILGFSPGDLIIVAARPSIGKTSFCLNICANLIKKKKKSLFYTLEMSKEQIILRILSIMTNIEIKKIFKKELKTLEIKKLKKNFKKINKFVNFIDSKKFTINLIDKNSKKYKMIFIDYLQLIYLKKDLNRNNEIAEISRILKKKAIELNIPIVVISQLNRNSEQRINKRPILSDLKDSGSIEQDSDMIIFLYRNDFYDLNNKNIEIILGKNRNGNTGIIKLKFLKKLTKFS